MSQEINLIEISELKNKVKELQNNGYRIIQINCTACKENYEVSYCFEKEYQMKIYRIFLPIINPELISISDIYFTSFLYENEIHDLFGINITGLALDFKGTLYQTAVKNPWKIAKKKEKSGEKNDN